MRHPFDGIIVPETPQQETPSVPTSRTRRSLLKVLAGAVAGLFGWASTARAQEQPKTNVLSLVLGEAGSTAANRRANMPMTDALNEDGGPRVTTFALGEEGATKAKGEDGGATTKRVGEEGGITTKAIGEEGGPQTKALREDGGRATTLAIGEEGGKQEKLPPKATTFALGEEGGEKNPITTAEGEQG